MAIRDSVPLPIVRPHTSHLSFGAGKEYTNIRVSPQKVRSEGEKGFSISTQGENGIERGERDNISTIPKVGTTAYAGPVSTDQALGAGEAGGGGANIPGLKQDEQQACRSTSLGRRGKDCTGGAEQLTKVAVQMFEVVGGGAAARIALWQFGTERVAQSHRNRCHCTFTTQCGQT